MEHARGAAQAQAYNPGAGKDAAGDVNMYAVDDREAPGFAYESPDAARWAVDEAMAAGDWDAALYALKGAKGKGGAGKGLSKGGGKGKGGGDKGGGASFQGHCHHCGIWGHRKHECNRLTAELAAKGKGDKGGGKGGKGGAGGKNPLNEVAAAVDGDGADDDWAGDGAEDLAAEAWSFDSLIASVGAEWATPRPSRRSRRQVGPLGCRSRGSLRGAPGGCSSAPTAVHNSFASLNLLVGDGDNDELLATVSAEAPGGRVVEAVVDSGAVHSVTPPGRFPGRVCPSPWSRTGRGYRAANGTRIANLGQAQVPFSTSEGHRCAIPFQVAPVEQPLLSVAHLTEAGNRVTLGDKDGQIVNTTTGRTIGLERRGRVYIMKMYIPAVTAKPPFQRQGA